MSFPLARVWVLQLRRGLLVLRWQYILADSNGAAAVLSARLRAESTIPTMPPRAGWAASPSHACSAMARRKLPASFQKESGRCFLPFLTSFWLRRLPSVAEKHLSCADRGNVRFSRLCDFLAGFRPKRSVAAGCAWTNPIRPLRIYA